MTCDDDLIRVWDDSLWRLEMSIAAPGFAYLEPKRHIPAITDLDEDEATTFGGVLAHVSRVLKEETGTQLASVSIPAGDAPHLRVHLVPHAGIAEENAREVAERVRHHLAEDPPPPPEQPQPLLLPYPVPAPRRWDPGQPEIPPPRREPPDDPRPDRPAHDPWF